MKKIILLSLVGLFSVSSVFAQRYPERREVRKGNRSYAKEDYQSADFSYRKVLLADSTVYQANFNLGDVLYRQENMEQAEKTFKALAEDSLRTEFAPQANYNLGNTFFQQKKYEQALEAYKNVLRVNPSDEDARFNLAYTQKMLEQQQNQDQDQNQDNKDQNQDQDQQNKDQQQQNQDQNKDQKDQGEDKQNQDPQQDQNQKENQQNQQPQQASMDKQEAERMLQAMQQSEDKTREKVQAEKAKGVVQSGKNW